MLHPNLGNQNLSASPVPGCSVLRVAVSRDPFEDYMYDQVETLEDAVAHVESIDEGYGQAEETCDAYDLLEQGVVDVDDYEFHE